jgi:glycosidase
VPNERTELLALDLALDLGPVKRVAMFLAFLLLGAACHDAPSAATPPTRACGLEVWYMPASASSNVSLVSSWLGWDAPGQPLTPANDGWLAAKFDLPSGEYTYSLVVDGAVMPNPYVPTTGFHDGREVTWVSVPDCSVPELTVTSGKGSATGDATFGATFLASRAGDPIDPESVTAVDRDGTSLPRSAFDIDAAAGTIAVSAHGLAKGKHTFTLSAKDTHGRVAETALATAWIEPYPFELRDTVIYEIVVDRYRNAAGALPPPTTMASRAGGTIDGVRLAIESGEIESLGANTIWISPLYKGPVGTFPGSPPDGHEYTDYHGYWPAEERELEPTQADEASLDAMIAAAHAHGLRVLFDVVPNHVHQANPYWEEHKADGWFNHPDGKCLCGITCDWATHIIDCWFAPYMPDLDWKNPAVADQLTSDVTWWMDRFDGDGIRIDTVPMMWRLATRRVAASIRGRFDNPGHSSFLLGENFVGDTGYDQLRYELGPFGLNSEFHFPLLWSLRNVIASESLPMSDIDVTIHSSEDDWDGSGAIMSLILGNQDVPRFASVSAGTADGDPWTPAPQSTDPVVYAKQRLAMAVMFALPGAPTVYYGDEVGLAGGNDPDSRRVMPADSELNPMQLATRAFVQRLGAARSCSGALRAGSYRTLFADDEHLIFAREAPGVEPVVAVFMRHVGGTDKVLEVPLPGISPGPYVDLIAGGQASLRPELTNLPAESFFAALYVPANGECARVAPKAP